MTTQIALAGKGSAGKSTLVPHLVAHLRRAHPALRLLVVDADPHMSATTLLGAAPPATLGQLRSRHERALVGGGPRDETREAFAERAMAEEALLRQPGYDLLALGHWELPGSQCAANRVLERAASSLARRYDLVLYDHEAGIEHIGRFASIPLDLLLLVATPEPLFLDVASRILERSREVGRPVARRWLALNRMRWGDVSDDDLWRRVRSMADVQVAGLLPESPGLSALARSGGSPLLLDPADPWSRAVATLGAQMSLLARPGAKAIVLDER